MPRNTLFAVALLAPFCLTACGKPDAAPAAQLLPSLGSAAVARPTADENDAVGVVQAVNTDTDTLTISHEPIDKLGWPAMTMPFKVSNPALLQGLEAGQKVQFHLKGTDMATATVTSVQAANR